MQRMLACALVLLMLAGCTQQQGTPQLPEGPTPSAAQDGDPPILRPVRTNASAPNNATQPGPGNETSPPDAPTALFELSAAVLNVSGPSPAKATLRFDAVSLGNENGTDVFFTYVIDFTSPHDQLAGDSRDFIAPNGSYQPLIVERHYQAAGLYNVTFKAHRIVEDRHQNATARTSVIVEAGPTYDQLCPTDTGALAIGTTRYQGSDGHFYTEHNTVEGLQRPDLGPDCPFPDVLDQEFPPSP